jgi:hypothetical protein
LLRRVFGPKREKVAGGWRRLHNERLRNFYASPNSTRAIKSRSMRWVEHIALMVQMINAFNILVGEPKGRRPIGRPRRRCKYNIRMDLRERGKKYFYWIHLAQCRDKWRATELKFLD